MANIQQFVHQNEEIRNILQESANDWIAPQHLIVIFQNVNTLPVSNVKIGGEERVIGLFLYQNSRYTDELEWDDVNQPRRRNCRSFTLPNDVNYTEATFALPGGGLHIRRVYRSQGAGHGNRALAHYRQIA